MTQYAGTPTLPRAARARRAAMARNVTLSERARRLARTIWKHRWYYLLLIPPLAYYVIFRYIPIYNAQIAFKDFRALAGVEGSPWVGFQHFATFFEVFQKGQTSLLQRRAPYQRGREVSSLVRDGPAQQLLSLCVSLAEWAAWSPAASGVPGVGWSCS